EFTELLSRESTAIRRVGAVNQRVQGIDNPIRITDLCPYFYKLRIRRSFGTPYYVVRVYNKGSVSISIESMQIDFPFSQFDDPGNYDIELLGTGKNVRPGTHRDIIVTKTVDAIGGAVGCPGENNINLSPSIFPGVFDMS